MNQAVPPVSHRAAFRLAACPPVLLVQGGGVGSLHAEGAGKTVTHNPRWALDVVCQTRQDNWIAAALHRRVPLDPSAPNYCGAFDNAGAMMSVDESLMCSFKVLKPVKGKI